MLRPLCLVAVLLMAGCIGSGAETRDPLIPQVSQGHALTPDTSPTQEVEYLVHHNGDQERTYTVTAHFGNLEDQEDAWLRAVPQFSHHLSYKLIEGEPFRVITGFTDNEPIYDSVEEYETGVMYRSAQDGRAIAYTGVMVSKEETNPFQIFVDQTRPHAMLDFRTLAGATLRQIPVGERIVTGINEGTEYSVTVNTGETTSSGCVIHDLEISWWESGFHRFCLAPGGTSPDWIHIESATDPQREIIYIRTTGDALVDWAEGAYAAPDLPKLPWAKVSHLAGGDIHVPPYREGDRAAEWAEMTAAAALHPTTSLHLQGSDFVVLDWVIDSPRYYDHGGFDELLHDRAIVSMSSKETRLLAIAQNTPLGWAPHPQGASTYTSNEFHLDDSSLPPVVAVGDLGPRYFDAGSSTWLLNLLPAIPPGYDLGAMAVIVVTWSNCGDDMSVHGTFSLINGQFLHRFETAGRPCVSTLPTLPPGPLGLLDPFNPDPGAAQQVLQAFLDDLRAPPFDPLAP